MIYTNTTEPTLLSSVVAVKGGQEAGGKFTFSDVQTMSVGKLLSMKCSEE